MVCATEAVEISYVDSTQSLRRYPSAVECEKRQLPGLVGHQAE